MSTESNRQSQLLRALSDPTRFCIIEVLSEGKSHKLSVNNLQKDLLQKNKKLTGPNLCQHLRALEKAGLLNHEMGKQEKWFSAPKQIYVEILECAEEMERLVTICTHVLNAFLLHPRIKYAREEDKHAMVNEFSNHVRTLLMPENFQLMDPKLTWEIYKRAAELKLELSELI